MQIKYAVVLQAKKMPEFKTVIVNQLIIPHREMCPVLIQVMFGDERVALQFPTKEIIFSPLYTNTSPPAPFV